MITPNSDIKAQATTVVDQTNTAITAQSGSLAVFGTPFMVALMEKATCTAVSSILEEGETTVGTKINVSHIKASGVGAKITASAVLTQVDGRKLTFSVSAFEGDGTVIGEGTIERFVVLADKFMRKVESK
jgi:predicted thioesterase